ncbi:MAG: 3-deoxy-D-manno-octulosonic acid transferase [Acidobacteria bacterium]|nr:3-deoxy-D-manno-octulosonic acid transferase [Acidobacteriota bacterium]
MSLLDACPALFLIYSLLFSLGVILTAPYYLWRLRGKIISGAGWKERFGYLPASFRQEQRSAIWVHAVSVGETLAVAGLVRALGERYPERKIFLSHVTPAGREASENRIPVAAGRFFLPLDWAFAVRRALDCLRPSLLLIVETELWPNLTRAAQASGARVVVVNARISDRSYPRYKLACSFMRRVLENVDQVFAQSPRDTERFLSLGAKPERVLVTGNLKFDASPPQSGELANHLEGGLRLAERGPIFVAASTMPGEESLLVPVWSQIRRHAPRALMILAPRHPARFDAVSQLLARQGVAFVRRTELEMDQEKMASQLAVPEVLILDSIGELAGIFAVANVVFMGGSLVPTGGHNLLEAAFWNKPILFGPHMQNFRDMAELFLRSGAAVQIRDHQELARSVIELIENPDRCRQLGEAARNLLEQESGATRRILDHLNDWLETSSATNVHAHPRSLTR